MLSKSSNNFSQISEFVENKVKQTRSNISNLVFAALLISGVGMNTEAEANTTPIKNSGAVYHYIVSGDTLYNISRRYGVEISEIQKINNLKDTTINLGDSILIKIGEIQKISSIKKPEINNIKTPKPIRTRYSEEKESTPYNENSINYSNFKLNPTVKYYKMYTIDGNSFNSFYTISPSDTPVFLGKVGIKKNGEKYIKVKLSNDKNKTGYVILSAFNEQDIELINRAIKKSSRNNNSDLQTQTDEIKSTKNTRRAIVKKETTINKPQIGSEFNTVISNTVKWSGNKRNPVHISMPYIQQLSAKLIQERNNVLQLQNESDKRKYILSKIENFRKHIRFQEIPRVTTQKLFDYYATLERVMISREYFKNLSGNDLYDNHIASDFSGNGEEALKAISDKLVLRSNFILNKKNAQKYRGFIAKGIKYYENKLGVNIDEQKFYGMIKHEGLFNELNIGPTGDYGMGMLTEGIYGGKDKVPGYKYSYSTYINPLNPQENILRSIEHIATMYKSFGKYKNRRGYNINDIVFVSYNHGAGTVSKMIKNYGSSWHYYITNGYLINIKTSTKNINQFYAQL